MSLPDAGFGPVLEKSQNILASQRLAVQPRSLSQLLNATKKLAQKPDPNAELSAHIFFASKGIDLSKHSTAMHQLRAAASQEIVEPVEDLDVDAFLEHQHEMLISSAVEECSRINAGAFYQQYLGRLDDDWTATKRDILESMNFQMGEVLSDPSGASSATSAPTSAALVAVSSSSPESDAERDAYARVVSALVFARLEQPESEPSMPSTHFPLAAYLCDAADAAESARCAALGAGGSPAALDAGLALPASDTHDLWSLLASMVGPSAQTRESLGLEPHHTAQLLLPTPAAAAARSAHPHQLRAHLAAGARAFAESLFEQHVRGVLSQSPALQALAARHGAAPAASWDRESSDPRAVRAIIADVEAYVASSEFKARIASGTRAYAAAVTGAAGAGAGAGMYDASLVAAPTSAASPWARVFCLLRAGAARAAAEYVQTHIPAARALAAALALSARAQPLGTAWRQLLGEMTAAGAFSLGGGGASAGGDSHDPFRVAVYHLVGRFKADAATTRALLTPFAFVNVEDYLWGKLSLAWLDDREPLPEWFTEYEGATQAQAQQRLSLVQLQAHVLRLGEGHFNPDGTAPLLYTRVLLMTQQFEQAAAYLARVDQALAAHLTIALAHYSLIRCAEPTDPLLAPVAAPAAAAAAAAAAGGAPTAYALNGALVLLRYAQSLAATQPSAAFYYLYALRGLPVAANAAVLGLSSPARTHTGPDASALGLDAPHIVSLLVAGTPASLDVLVGTTRSPWLGLPQLATVGLIPACYPLAAAATLLGSAAEALMQRDCADSAARLLALAQRPLDAGTVLLEALVSLLAAPPGAAGAGPQTGAGSGALKAAVANATAFISAYRSPAAAAAVGAEDTRLPGLVSSLSTGVAAATLLDEVERGPSRYPHALRALDALALYPASTAPAATAAAAARFAELHPSLRRVSGPLVLAAARLLGALHAQAVAHASAAAAASAAAGYAPGSGADEVRAQADLADMRRRAKGLTSFVLNSEFDHIGRSVRLELMRLDALVPN